MDSLTFFIAWISSVTVMSAFSSLWSDVADQNFREHNLLSHIFTKGTLPTFTTKQWIVGWAIHFFFGAVFLLCYEVLWNVTGIVRSVVWSVAFGVIIGIIGVLGWILMFKFCKDRPQIPFTHYYFHLVLAHIVFSLTAYGVYYIMN
ncbi:MAG: hypothetical protein ACSHXF_09795 [Aquaticitalea sp.]